MKIFGQVIRTAVNLVTLPINVATDVVMSPYETKWPNGPGVGRRTTRNIERLKDEASE